MSTCQRECYFIENYRTLVVLSLFRSSIVSFYSIFMSNYYLIKIYIRFCEYLHCEISHFDINLFNQAYKFFYIDNYR